MINRIILIVLISTNYACAQVNLVRNHSFEEYDNCPTGEGWLNFDIPFWNDTLFYGTPDYFNLCSSPLPFPTYGVPYNSGGFQYAKEGNAYALIITYKYNVSNAREYLVTELTDTIIKGIPYLIKFYVNPLDNRQFATNKLGAHLSKEIPDFNNNNLFEYTPQILNDGLANPLTDTSSWILITDTFISNVGGEKYLSIGNFFDDIHCDTVSIGDWINYIIQAVYFVDDVWVTALDTTVGINEVEESKLLFKIYPNPNNGQMILDYDLGELSGANLVINNIYGQEVFNYYLKEGKNRIVINLNQFAGGLYMARISMDEKTLYKEKIIIVK